MPGEERIVRIEQQTFADDSFNTHDPHGPVVVGRVPQWAGLTWQKELSRILGGELKWGKVRRKWPDLASDLRRAIMRDLRDSLISIADPSIHRLQVRDTIESAVKYPRSAWSKEFLEWSEAQEKQWATKGILLDSPAGRVERYASMPDVLVTDFEVNHTVLEKYAAAFDKPHNARLFTARSSAAFASVLDREEWASVARAALEERRYVTPEQLGRKILAKGESTQHVFDEGNRTSVSAINDLRNSVRRGLSKGGLIILPGFVQDGAVERTSHSEPRIQAGDLAAGYAKDLYESSDGIRRVCEEFKGVILNGSMVRDWKQVERVDLDRLRT